MAISNTTPSGNFGDYGDHVYKTKQFMYPNDLLSVDPSKNEYGNQYMLIYINITADSKFTRVDDKGTDLNKIKNYSTRVGRELSGQKVLGGLRGDLVAGAITTLSSIGGGITATAGLGALGVGISALGTATGALLTGEFSRPRKRLQAAIALHIPNNIAINYGVTYGEADADLLSMTERGMNAVFNNNADKLTKSSDADDSPRTGGDTALALGMKGLSGTETGKVIGKLAGIAYNPKKEQIFEGVPFRNFSYTYDFYPRSEEESENVKRIIDELKYHMHPEFKDANAFLFTYPAEFDIMFMHKGQENRFLHKHRSAVLESMNVNYAPNAQYSTFANGSPTGYQVTLNFKEVSIITKDALESTGEVSIRRQSSPVRDFGGQSDTY